ncbi:hypothetical protein [Paenibacillus sp.]|uniref:hypothetical protein n=1 Tax=Paenibacillus sp. TaxID=58172 RepID=UPI002811B255|nr:hypothetical protein [Paenibacillus sp.]
MIWLRMSVVDAKQTLRDPMLLFMTAAPLLILAALRYAAPYGLSLLPGDPGPGAPVFAALVSAVALLLVPLLPGTMAGLLLLDERDERLAAVLAVTPLRKSGYFGYRLAFPFVLSAGYAAALPTASGLLPAAASGFALVPSILAAAALAPMFAVLMGALAANKLEGLAVSKLSGWVVFAPGLLLAPEPAQWVGALVPTYWIAKSYVSAASGDVAAASGWGIGALCYLVVLFVWLFRKYLRRIE